MVQALETLKFFKFPAFWGLLFCLIVIPFTASANPKYAGLVIETSQEVILYEKNADALRHPASLTKAMTIYMAFDMIKSGKWSWDTRLPVSEHAAAASPTKINLKAGSTVTVRDLVESLIVHSANDSARVIGEAISGTESNFGRTMTKKARALGMSKTTFTNASGLPDPDQVTTARDMVRLAMALQKHFPSYYPMFKTASFTYRGQSYQSHNRVMKYYKGATGLKTGFIRASGFNLITTAERNGYNVIAVVMGGISSKSRDNHMITLLDGAFHTLRTSPEIREARNRNFAPYPTEKPRRNEFEMAYAAQGLNVQDEADGQDMTALEAVEDGQSADESGFEKPLTQGDHDATKRGYPIPVLRATALAQEAPQVTSLASITPAEKPSLEKPLALAPTPQSAPMPQNLAAKPVAPTALSNAGDKDWGIQVGTFSSAKDAMLAAANAMTAANQPLQGSVIRIADYGSGRNQLHRAHLANLTEEQARAACNQLLSTQTACFVFRNLPLATRNTSSNRL